MTMATANDMNRCGENGWKPSHALEWLSVNVEFLRFVYILHKYTSTLLK